jgi:hypothetical protein
MKNTMIKKSFKILEKIDAAWQIRGLNRLFSCQVVVYPVLPGAAR